MYNGGKAQIYLGITNNIEDGTSSMLFRRNGERRITFIVIVSIIL